ncbi:triosephosphate isomerase [Paracoccidioides lutzii Pb01]|uniref:Triosephosphate isomerase n=1 Tax=Paracoccidioides lutzii (strain ATCC MYA-826 / Pb01) TaxID=502779 RepID=C1H6R9_PARBA|nr:triosephosphate isomerase [Paracoccidioides lutzii Pb01]EEH35413.2 triosephosphate isomerase [Paracoccidioides lutzii Pb01]
MAPPEYPLLPKTLLVISLKTYFTPSRTITYLRSLIDPQNEILRPDNRSQLLLALIPDFLTIYPCSEILQSHFPELQTTEQQYQQQQNNQRQPPPFLLGAQDCFWKPLGPYTGEISPSCLKDLNVSLVELGHAERRDIFHETDEQVGRKAAAVSVHGMIPLVCVGEVSWPGSIMADAVRTAVVECAVQPVPAGVEHVAGVVEGIRRVVRGSGREGDIRVLYGGSAGPGLWGKGGLGKAVDGMFLGRFAHEIEGVRKVVREVEETF